jgi:hypothetical protein
MKYCFSYDNPLSFLLHLTASINKLIETALGVTQALHLCEAHSFCLSNIPLSRLGVSSLFKFSSFFMCRHRFCSFTFLSHSQRRFLLLVLALWVRVFSRR